MVRYLLNKTCIFLWHSVSASLLKYLKVFLKGSALRLHILQKFLFIFSRLLRHLSKDWLLDLSQFLAAPLNILNPTYLLKQRGFCLKVQVGVSFVVLYKYWSEVKWTGLWPLLRVTNTMDIVNDTNSGYASQ